MNTLSIKLPPDLDHQVEAASRSARITKSELVRRALAAYVSRRSEIAPEFVSALDQAGDLVGCFQGGPKNLATDPRFMKDFGKR